MARYNPPMEIKHLVSKYVYRIEPKPEGGFIARASDANVPPLEAATREELQEKIQSTILAGLGTDFPGLKLSSHASELKFAFHVEKQPDGTFDIHSSDTASGPFNAPDHDQVESHFAEKLISFVGKHMLQDAPEGWRAQLASGDIKVFVHKSSGFTIKTKEDGHAAEFRSLSQLFGDTQQGARPTSSLGPGNSDEIVSNSPASFNTQSTPIDSSPITPGSEGAGKFLRILLVLTILAAVMFFFLRHH
ncbi:MAG TPA: hypothetical protein VN708_03165 [Terriglobales bacterium]|nr:hypothetical protein [Terriglobales bacterium]